MAAVVSTGAGSNGAPAAATAAASKTLDFALDDGETPVLGAVGRRSRVGSSEAAG